MFLLADVHPEKTITITESTTTTRGPRQENVNIGLSYYIYFKGFNNLNPESEKGLFIYYYLSQLKR